MLGALLFLRLTSLRNRVRSQLRRLRQPKYLVGTLFVVGYFWFFFFRPTAPSAHAFPGTNPLSVMPAELAALLSSVVALGLTIVLVLMWLLPDEAPGVKFTEAEIAFLFPAPLSRRSLIHFKVCSLQLSSLLQSCFFVLIFNHRHLFHGEALRAIVSWWVVLGLVRLHYLGASLTLARLQAAGLAPQRRRLFLIASLVALGAMSVAVLWPKVAALPASASVADTAELALTTGVLPWLLWPAKLIVAPFFATSFPGLGLALAPALLVLAGHYFWVVHTEVSFEEAAIAQAERQAARVAELHRTGNLRFGAGNRAGRHPPFPLERVRWPEAAILWKNLLSTARPWFTLRAWSLTAGTLVLLSAALQRLLGSSYWMAGSVMATLGVMAVGLALFYGPLLTRLDLRQDLANTDLLRTYPLPGWRILLGELLAPIAILSGLIWLGLLAWYLGLHGHQPPSLSEEWFSPAMRLVLVGVVAALTPLVVALQLLVPNGAVIFFPAMFRAAHTPGSGLDLMGQRMLFGFGQLFVLALVLLPAVVTAGVLIFCTQWLIGPAAAVIFAAMAVAVVLLAEIACGVWWLGARFERFDLSQELHA